MTGEGISMRRTLPRRRGDRRDDVRAEPLRRPIRRGPITRRDWWLGIALVAAALVAHALLPRHQTHTIGMERYGFVVTHDRWTGAVTTRWADDLANEQ